MNADEILFEISDGCQQSLPFVEWEDVDLNAEAFLSEESWMVVVVESKTFVVFCLCSSLSLMKIHQRQRDSF